MFLSKTLKNIMAIDHHNEPKAAAAVKVINTGMVVPSNKVERPP